ncbi:MAG: oatA 1 [Myxococcales bacterium]|nr:oatA 1 [Myxococcales bacterium]
MARRIPSLDGIRAIAILLVLLGHSISGLPAAAFLIEWFEVGSFGVSIFFVLSGYLITRLLVEELERDGSISLKRFYIRRFFRIVPAYYLYLTCILVVSRMGGLTVPRSGILPAYLFVWNYAAHASGWFYGHSWSLSMEEQFYLLWPPVLAALGKARGLRLAVGIILVAPFSRLATYALFPAHRGQITAMLHSHGDILMFGALLALGSGEDKKDKNEKFERVVSWLFARKAHVVAAFVLFANILIGHALRGSYTLPVGMSVEAACIALLLLWLVRNPGSWVGRPLNTGPMIFIGSISYSLYLWQQAFVALFKFPWSLALTFLAALTSYHLVELPFLRLRDRVLSGLRRPTPTTMEEVPK